MREVYEDELHSDYAAFHAGRQRDLPAYFLPFTTSKLSTKGRLLDIGCGDGLLMKTAQKSGMEAWGIDFDSKSVAAAKQNYSLDHCFSMSLEEFREYSNSHQIKFDVITFFEVLEHQDDPRGFMEIVSSLLSKDGHIAGSVPNRNRFLATYSNRAFGAGDNPPHHFTRWSVPVLKSFLQSLQFQNVHAESCNYLSFFEVSYWWQRVLAGNGINALRHKVKKSIVPDGVSAHATMASIEKKDTKYKRIIPVLKAANTAAKVVEKALFAPLAAATYSLVNKQGQQIYFEAYYKNDT